MTAAGTNEWVEEHGRSIRSTPTVNSSRRCALARANAAGALVLHGGGRTVDKDRSVVLATALAENGFDAIAFDFSGHGDSTGALDALTLNRRARQASAALQLFGGKPSIVCGFSMSGQTACDLLGLDGSHIRCLVLFAPAIYAVEARDLPFGSAEFTDRIRQERSWRTSDAFSLLRCFNGQVLLFTSPSDDVIPPEVVEALEQAAPHVRHVRLEGSPHQLGRWLTEHPEAAERVAALIRQAFDAASA